MSDESSSQESESGVIDVIIYKKANEVPNAHMLLGSSFKKVELKQLQHFWYFEINCLQPDIASIDLYISPEIGQTTVHTMRFTDQQPFAFVDALPENQLVPFDDFLLFFNNAIPSKNSLSFKFMNKTENNEMRIQLSSIKQFVGSFDDKYFLWSLIYISAQPWYEIFRFNQELSDYLLSIIPQYITQHFYEPPQESKEIDVHNFSSYLEFPYNLINHKNHVEDDINVNGIYEQDTYPNSKFTSAEYYVDTFFHFIRQQIGNGFVYLLSLFFDFNNDFPLTPYIPTLDDYICSKEVNDLLKRLIESFSTFEKPEINSIYERIYYTILMTATSVFDIDMKPLFDVLEQQLNPNIIAKILSERMIFTKLDPEKLPNIKITLKFLISAIPNFSQVIEVFKNDEIIPLEWIQMLSEIYEIDDLTQIILNSLKQSIPSHYASCFAKVTENGALIQDDDFDDSDVILQPGTIIQTGAKIGKHSIMMAGSIATANSELCENSYCTLNGILPRKDPVISKSAILQESIILKRGITIDDNTKVFKNSSIGTGAQIQKDVTLYHGSQINNGCIVKEGEKVSGSIVIPAGFRYSRKIIEFEEIIPEVILRYTLMFIKRYSGFLDLETLLSFNVPNKTILFLRYFIYMSNYPYQAGIQLATHQSKITFIDEDNSKSLENEIYQILGSKCLHLAYSYFKTIFDNESLNTNQTVFNILVSLCSKSIHNYNLSIDEFCEEKIITAVQDLTSHIPILSKSGVPTEDITLLKDILFDTCDNIIARIKLSDGSEDTQLYEMMQQIIKSVKE